MLTAAIADATWRIAVRAPLPLRCWDGDYVVYNPLSGNTHVFDIVTGEVLKAIMAGDVDTGDVSTEGLCRHIAGFLEVPDDTAIAEHVGRILAALDRLALIEPADGC